MIEKSTVSTNTWHYLAGLLDGDGCFTFGCAPKEGYINYDIVVTLTTTHLPTAEWVIETFGGKFYPAQDKRPNRKLQHCWHIPLALDQLEIARNVQDKMILKGNQARLIGDFIELGGRLFQDNDFRKTIVDQTSRFNDVYVPIVKTKKGEPSVIASKNFTEQDLRYFGGLVDAEGTISLYRSKGSYSPRLSVCNTDKRVFDYILPMFGGRVNGHQRYGRELGSWYMPMLFMENVLNRIKPFLVTKRKQADLLSNWLDERYDIPKKVHEEYIKEFRILNHRGKSPEANTLQSSDEDVIESYLCEDVQSAPLVTAAA